MHIYYIVMKITLDYYSFCFEFNDLCLAIFIDFCRAIIVICDNYLYQYFGMILHFITIYISVSERFWTAGHKPYMH